MRQMRRHWNGVVQRGAGAVVQIDMRVGGAQLLEAGRQETVPLELLTLPLPGTRTRGVRVSRVELVLINTGSEKDSMLCL